MVEVLHVLIVVIGFYKKVNAITHVIAQVLRIVVHVNHVAMLAMVVMAF
jgi:hypothetical protein